MDRTSPPPTENQPDPGDRLRQESRLPSSSPGLHPSNQLESPPPSTPAADKLPEIRIRKSLTLPSADGKAINLEVFTLTLGGETIELLPLKNWSQLDRYKWTARGKLPAEPAGLEIAFDHVRIAGETVAINDPEGCAKLERLFNEWLLLEKETLELARRKAHPQALPAASEPHPPPEAQGLLFRVEVDKRGQVYIHCAQGKDTVASIGLTAAGFNSLCQQGLMRKPHTLQTGALHDWVELDGELCSFEKGRNDVARLEQILNQRYVPAGAAGPGKGVVIFQNAASSTGFDIQFPVMVGGVPHDQRHHLNEQSLEPLQDPHRCGLLHNEIIVKLVSPNLVFKQKTPDGGEQYLARRPENTVSLPDEHGQQKTIDLSQPLNLLHLSAAELTAVFNHPAINRHTKAAPAPRPASEPQPKPALAGPPSQAQPHLVPPAPRPSKPEPLPEARKPGRALTEPKPMTPPPERAPKRAADEPGLRPVEMARPLPNLWLKEILAQPALRPDWFTCLAYSKIAERFGNSSAGKFGPGACWFISLGESQDIADPAFKGIFLTEKGSLGFLNEGQMARFYNGVAFLGARESALEGIEVNLVAVGLDAGERVVFILSDNFRAQFGVPEATLTEVINRLSKSGAVIMSVGETLASRESLEVVWTVPAEQSDPNDPQALESIRPPA